MSKNSTRSISDGDLTSSTNCNGKNGEVISTSLKHPDKQFFTLPRWMSYRKRTKSKIKYVKVDVPYNQSKYENESVDNKVCIDRKHNNFVNKLFRRSSFFSNSNYPKNQTRKYNSKTFQTISSSNTDIRSSNIVLSPFDYQEYFRDKVPAVTGIKNHGNTCFMNAVIQCLSNIDIFAEYFVMGRYRIDFNRRNKVHSKKYGTRGEVTEQLAILLKSLWSCQYYANISNKFKNLVAKYGAQYEGNEQHDAQEFLLWLLDKVHEDLNTATKQKYKKSKASFGRTDEEIAAEMLANHLRCNSSFIHDLFQGQIRSSLCCLGCGRFSNTFDPYLCISVPIPQYQMSHIFLYLVYFRSNLKMTKVGVSIDSQAIVLDLFEKMSKNFGLSRKVILTEIIDGKFVRTFKDSDPVTCLKDSNNLFAIEIPEPKVACAVEQEKIILIVSCNLKHSEDDNEMFWKPFAIEILREISYKELQLQILSIISPVVRDSINLESELPFSLIVTDDESSEVLCSSVDLPLYMPIIDHALMLLDEKGPKYLKVTLQWQKQAEHLLLKEAFFSEDHPSVAALKSNSNISNELSLYECLDMYFNEERIMAWEIHEKISDDDIMKSMINDEAIMNSLKTLNAVIQMELSSEKHLKCLLQIEKQAKKWVEDAWMCPRCHHRLPSIKQLSLWTVPDILIVHLKRFRQSSTQRTKITTFVKCPYSGLDLHPYVAPRNGSIQPSPHNSLAFWSPWKRSRSHPYAKSEEYIYDLCAVCNHHGNIHGGHYTAYCRNPINGHWYLFDDTNVKEIQASEVISSDAYILFYQRSSLNAPSCASSSSSGYSSASSTNSIAFDHWAFHMPLLYRDVAITSKSQDNLYDVGNTSSLDRRMTPRPFHRTSRSYSTMPHFNDDKMYSPVQRNGFEPAYIDSRENKIEIPPPPPPSTKHYWTVTSV